MKIIRCIGLDTRCIEQYRFNQIIITRGIEQDSQEKFMDGCMLELYEYNIMHRTRCREQGAEKS